MVCSELLPGRRETSDQIEDLWVAYQHLYTLASNLTRYLAGCDGITLELRACSAPF